MFSNQIMSFADSNQPLSIRNGSKRDIYNIPIIIYMETLFATITILLVPNISSIISDSPIIPYFLNVILIILITLVTNMIRAFRFCDSKEHSYGVEYGLKKGLVTGTISNLVLLLLDVVPKLRYPLTILSYVPILSNMVDGVLLSLTYFFSYYIVAWPIWGSC